MYLLLIYYYSNRFQKLYLNFFFNMCYKFVYFRVPIGPKTIWGKEMFVFVCVFTWVTMYVHARACVYVCACVYGIWGDLGYKHVCKEQVKLRC